MPFASKRIRSRHAFVIEGERGTDFCFGQVVLLFRQQDLGKSVIATSQERVIFSESLPYAVASEFIIRPGWAFLLKPIHLSPGSGEGQH